jgi:hypothetical protein
MQYDNTNTGLLGKNDRKRPDRQGDNGQVLTDPDYTGSINVEGVEYWLDARIKVAGPTAKNPGSKFFSLKLRRKEGQKAQKAPVQVPVQDFVDDELPPF